MNALRRIYELLVRHPVSNQIMLGLLGVWGLYSGISSYLQQHQPLPGEMTIGVLAIICAAQGLTKTPWVEVMCSWRLLLTFYCLYMGMKIMADSGKGALPVVPKAILVIAIAAFFSRSGAGLMRSREQGRRNP